METYKHHIHTLFTQLYFAYIFIYYVLQILLHLKSICIQLVYFSISISLYFSNIKQYDFCLPLRSNFSMYRFYFPFREVIFGTLQIFIYYIKCAYRGQWRSCQCSIISYILNKEEFFFKFLNLWKTFILRIDYYY